MMKPSALDQSAHTRSRWINARLLLETALLFAALAGLANVVGPQAGQSVGWLAVYLVILLAQGLMLQRLYIIAHEAAHRKLRRMRSRRRGMVMRRSTISDNT